ncbi:MAG: type II toxin-antitoxin system Phd/YefM family antitoxin [Acidobacteria bacterium]|nr:type II toxin-antitoxin system Phd/YefM family antitoxin [Acidobacteriota bacterium]
MPTIGATEFKAKCLTLLDDVKRKRHELIVTKRGKPVAKLVPIEDDKRPLFGRMKGTVEIVGDIFSTGEKWNADAD